MNIYAFPLTFRLMLWGVRRWKLAISGFSFSLPHFQLLTKDSTGLQHLEMVIFRLFILADLES